MPITSKPVSNARANRGSGNSHVGGFGEGKREEAGRYIYVDNVGWINERQFESTRDSGLPAINVKNYEHCNRSFANWDTPNGKYVGSRAEYEKLMAQQGMVKANPDIKDVRKEYKLSKKGQAILEAGKNAADSKGRIDPSKLGDRTIQALVGNRKYDRDSLPVYKETK